jgi:hypothetical protein
MFEDMVRRNEESKATKTPRPKSEPLAVVHSGLPDAEAVAPYTTYKRSTPTQRCAVGSESMGAVASRLRI